MPQVGAKLLHVIAHTGEEEPVFSVANLEEKLAQRNGRYPVTLVFSRMHVRLLPLSMRCVIVTRPA